jgi:flagellin
MSVINTNVKSLITQNALKLNNRAMSNAMAQLSTGQRINSAADDAAGLAVSQSMTSQVRGLNMAVRNANDGISLAQTAEGAMVEISNMLQRMRELAVQAATGTLDTTQREYLDTEFTALEEQITSTIDTTKWNGMLILDDTTAQDFEIAIGADGDEIVTVTSMALTYTDSSVDTASNAANAVGAVDDALDIVNEARATLGAVINRLTSAADNMSNISQNITESRSRILDTDYAAATTELARTQIIQQAGMAVLAQANQQPQAVLALLR